MSDPELLLRLLRARPNISAAELCEVLAVDRKALKQMVQVADSEVLTISGAQRTRYAARRPLRGCEQPLPVIEIDEHGGYDQVAYLSLAYPYGSVLEWTGDCPWPLDEEMQEGWFEGLPYFLQDLQPSGFLGRAFALAHAHLLQLSENPQDWSEEDALQAVSRFAGDAVGNYIVGSSARDLYLKWVQNRPEPIHDPHVPEAYALLADEAMAGVAPGPIAAGECPKFLASREADDDSVNVLVKFSASDNSPSSQRWADLLICEHLAALCLSEFACIQTAETRIVQAGGRTFLESVRFDRHGPFGRSAVCSWAAVNYAWFGLAGRPWTEGARKLRERGLIQPSDVGDIACIWHFGRLIANTDVHDGNLSFRPHRIDSRAGFALAPVYDMLPMLYAPGPGVELLPVIFKPQLPSPEGHSAWSRAASAAVEVWDAATHDTRISDEFRAICAENRDQVTRAIESAGATARA